jgi:hypothetical protein
MDSIPSLRNIYDNTEYLSIKYDSYFPAYADLLSKYIDKPIVFVEVGIFNGGSLFMWREYFGQKARIIGIDLNPTAKDWEKFGFEIHIGDQSDGCFWENFYKEVGPIDILLDDGGHTNLQQITTSHYAIQNINDNGTLIVEDTHTSYFREFGNPFKYSFMNFAMNVVTSINSRSNALLRVGKYWDKVHSMNFYESIVAFHICRKACTISSPVSNNGKTKNADDFRYHGTIQDLIYKINKNISVDSDGRMSFFSKLIVYILNNLQFLISRLSYFKYRKYFK